MSQQAEALDTDCWNKLESGARYPDSGFHFLTLGSVDPQGKPQARTVVLRRVDGVKRILEFHTDMRSPKWQALTTHPHATVLGYCDKTQLRLQGTITLHGADSKLADAAWQRLTTSTQQTYAGPAPGSDFGGEVSDASSGRNNFGVMLFHVSQLDWCLLARDNNQRALLCYSDAGILISSKRVNP